MPHTKIKTVFIGSPAIGVGACNSAVQGREKDTLLIAVTEKEKLSSSGALSLALGKLAASPEGAYTSVLAFDNGIRGFFGDAGITLVVADLSEPFARGAAVAVSRLASEKGMLTIAVLPVGTRTDGATATAGEESAVVALSRWIHGTIRINRNSFFPCSFNSPLAYAGSQLAAMLISCLDEDCGGFTMREIRDYICPQTGFCCFASGTADGADKARVAAMNAYANLPAAAKGGAKRVLNETVIAPDGSLNDLFVAENVLTNSFPQTKDIVCFSRPDTATGDSITVNTIVLCR